MAKAFLDSTSSSVLYGVSGGFKANHALATARHRRKITVLHLSGGVKPDIVTVNAPFATVVAGTFLEIGEFRFSTPDQYLQMANLEAVAGLTADPSNSAGIPLTRSNFDRPLSSIIAAPTPIT